MKTIHCPTCKQKIRYEIRTDTYCGKYVYDNVTNQTILVFPKPELIDDSFMGVILERLLSQAGKGGVAHER